MSNHDNNHDVDEVTLNESSLKDTNIDTSSTETLQNDQNDNPFKIKSSNEGHCNQNDLENINASSIENSPKSDSLESFVMVDELPSQESSPTDVENIQSIQNEHFDEDDEDEVVIEEDPFPLDENDYIRLNIIRPGAVQENKTSALDLLEEEPMISNDRETLYLQEEDPIPDPDFKLDHDIVNQNDRFDDKLVTNEDEHEEDIVKDEHEEHDEDVVKYEEHEEHDEDIVEDFPTNFTSFDDEKRNSSIDISSSYYEENTGNEKEDVIPSSSRSLRLTSNEDFDVTSVMPSEQIEESFSLEDPSDNSYPSGKSYLSQESKTDEYFGLSDDTSERVSPIVMYRKSLLNSNPYTKALQTYEADSPIKRQQEYSPKVVLEISVTPIKKMEEIRVAGVIGRTASLVNGTYSHQSDTNRDDDSHSDNFNKSQRFLKISKESKSNTKVWLEYIPAIERWQFKPERGLGKDLCWAYIDSKDGKLFVSSNSRSIEMWTGKGPGSWWTAMPKVQIKESVQKGIRGVYISGFTGQFIRRINGFYEEKRRFIEKDSDDSDDGEDDGEEEFLQPKTSLILPDPQSDDSTDDFDDFLDVFSNPSKTEIFPRYKKQDSLDIWLEYEYDMGAWMIKPGRSLGLKSCWAYIDEVGYQLPFEITGKIWQAKDSFQKQIVQIANQ